MSRIFEWAERDKAFSAQIDLQKDILKTFSLSKNPKFIRPYY